MKTPPRGRGCIGLPPLGEDLDSLGRKAKRYHLCKRDSLIVVAQLCPEFTARIVDRWQELEAQLVPSIPQSFSEALRLAADRAEQKALAEQQRDAAPVIGGCHRGQKIASEGRETKTPP